MLLQAPTIVLDILRLRRRPPPAPGGGVHDIVRQGGKRPRRTQKPLLGERAPGHMQRAEAHAL